MLRTPEVGASLAKPAEILAKNLGASPLRPAGAGVASDAPTSGVRNISYILGIILHRAKFAGA
jgi:hypothetical protein